MQINNYRIFFKISRKGMGPTMLAKWLDFSNYRLPFILHFYVCKVSLDFWQVMTEVIPGLTIR